jgi:LysM repeat protein
MKKPNRMQTVGALALVLALVLPLLIGCGMQAAAASTASEIGYTGALDALYEDALDVTGQLALGTLQLEGTANAVTEAQATTLLALWQALQGDELQGESEQVAVLKQIEATMTDAQVSAIAGMRLTEQDAQTWLDAWGNAASTGEAQASADRQKPEGLPEGMTEEQLAQMRAQIQAQMGEVGGGQSMALSRAVVQLLTERSGSMDTQARAFDTENLPEAPPMEASSLQETRGQDASNSETGPEPAGEQERAEVVEPDAAETEAQPEAAEPGASEAGASETGALDESVSHTVRAGESLAGIAAAYGVTVASIVEANEIQDANRIEVAQELVIPNPSLVPEATSAGPSTAPETPGAPAAAVAAPALEQLPDNDPGPPLTIEVSANRATQDPLVEQSQAYLVTGLVRNDGDQTYAVSAIQVTFFDASGFRGTFHKYPLVPGGEWLWHGVTEADFAPLLLAPGKVWPFSVEIMAQDMASFVIHPDASPTDRESAPVALSEVVLVDEGTGYVRISGTATNDNAFAVQNVTVSGVLLDASGQIVSMGSTYVLQEDIEPGESVTFEVRVEKEPYADYQLYAQAERDWE